MLYRVLPRHPELTIFSLIPCRRPYPRPNEGNIEVFYEVSQIRVQIWPQMTLRMTLRMTLQDPPQTGPQITLRSLISQTSDTNGQNKALFEVLLTVAESKRVRSKDWIAPPT